jgi:hypothetical protein
VVRRLIELDIEGRPWAREAVDAAIARSGQAPAAFMAWIEAHAAEVRGQPVRVVCSRYAPPAATVTRSQEVAVVPRRTHSKELDPEARRSLEESARRSPQEKAAEAERARREVEPFLAGLRAARRKAEISQ